MRYLQYGYKILFWVREHPGQLESRVVTPWLRTVSTYLVILQSKWLLDHRVLRDLFLQKLDS